MIRQLSASEAANRCDATVFDGLPAHVDVNEVVLIGQERAVKALKLGLGMKSQGFNLYVSGSAGTGKLTAVTDFVARQAQKEPVPADWCYVNNFRDTYRPEKISLPPGTALSFKKDMKTLIRDMFGALVKAFESDEYASKKEKIVNSFVDEQSRILGIVSESAEKESFLIKQTPTSFITIPARENRSITEEELKALTPGQLNELNEVQHRLQEQLSAALREIRKIEKATDGNLDAMSREVAHNAMESLVEELNEKYKAVPQVKKFMGLLRDDVMDNLPEFMKAQKNEAGTAEGENPFLRRYEVTVLVDNGDTKGAPVVIERNPSYHNLLGRVDKESYMGTLVTDFTMIRKGALHSANGGYLIMRVEELFQNYLAWDCLKRALKNRELVIEEAADQLGYLTTRTLKPEPVPLNIKVILIGNTYLYQMMYQYDADFRELFKVKADFDSVMERTDENIRDYSRYVRALCAREALLAPGNEAMAKVIDYSSRMADDRMKLSTRFGAIADIVREANFYAVSDGADTIDGSHVVTAVDEKKYRSNLIQEKLNEMITTGQIFIDTSGEQVGQINGLSVLDVGDISFGIPARITCSVSPGKGGIVAIEREAEMSGPLHTKGVLILSGYLATKFMQDKEISLSARLVFEQSYAEVDGDSASSTELYAILSALSQLPVRQGIAVTGSVNQRGDIQPIGGVNEKIEGYFEICRKNGLTGGQGVMIPATNLVNLMLKDDVVKAVEAGLFTLTAVDTIEDGIEFLTGVKAGSIWEDGTAYCMVNNMLNTFAARLNEEENADAGDE